MAGAEGKAIVSPARAAESERRLRSCLLSACGDRPRSADRIALSVGDRLGIRCGWIVYIESIHAVGFRLAAVVPTRSPMSVIEAVAR